jgi:DNA primase
MQPNEVLDWEDFLKSNGCSNVIDTGQWVMCNCIFHGESNPSFGIDKESGQGHCFVCGWHNWEDICGVFGISANDFIEAMRENQWEALKRKLFKEKRSLTYKRYDCPHICHYQHPYSQLALWKYFKERNITGKSISEFYVHYCDDAKSKYNESFIFPVYDEKGVLYFQARYIGDNKYIQRWRFPKNCAKWKMHFNWVNVKNRDTVIFVEGPPNVMRLFEWGFPSVAAKDFSPYQIGNIIHSKVQRIFILYDRDQDKILSDGTVFNAGKKYSKRAKKVFSNCGKEVILLKLPEGYKDIAEVKTLDEFIDSNDTRLAAWYDRLVGNL